MRTAVKLITVLAAKGGLPAGTLMYDTGAGAIPEIGQTVSVGSFTRTAGEIALAATGATAFSQSYYYKTAAGAAFTRANGLAFVADVRTAATGIPSMGWFKSTTINGGNFIHAAGGNLTAYSAFFSTSPTTGTPSRSKIQYASILFATGAINTVNGVVQWYWDTENGASVYPGIANCGAGDAVAGFARLGVYDLTQHDSRWSALSTLCDAYATTPDTTPYTISRDAFIRWSMTAATGVTQTVTFRQVDADNYWIMKADQAGGTIKLYEAVTGVETEKATYTLAQTNGTVYKFSITLNGRSVRIFYTSASSITQMIRYDAMRTSLTGTGLVLSNAGANLVVLPAYLPLPSAVRRERIGVFAIGDSTILGTGDATSGENGGWPPDMIDLIGTDRIFEVTPRAGVSGRTTATWDANVAGGVPPTYVETVLGATNLIPTTAGQGFIFLKHSVNDITGAVPGTLPVEATFKTDLGAMIDAAHDARVNISVVVYKKVWRASGTYPTLADGYTNFATLNTWRDDVCTGRAYVLDGIDETVIVKGSDNGVSETTDGTHMNAATYATTAAAHRTIIGQ